MQEQCKRDGGEGDYYKYKMRPECRQREWMRVWRANMCWGLLRLPVALTSFGSTRVQAPGRRP